MVAPSTVPSPEATEAKEEPSSSLKADLPEMKTEHSPEVKMEGDTEKVICEASPTPVKTEMSEEDIGIGVAETPPVPVDLQSSGVKSEEVPAAPSVIEEEEKVADNPSVELLGNTSASIGNDNAKDEVATPTGEPSEELHSLSEAEVGLDSAVIVEAEDAAAGALETVPQVSTGMSGEEEASGDSLLSDNKLLTSEAESTEAPANLLGKPDAEAEEVADKESEVSCSTTEQSVEVEPQAIVEKCQELTEKPELAAAAEDLLPEDLLTMDEAVENPEKNVNEESPEQMFPKAQPSQGPEHVKADESCETGTLVATSAPGAQAASASETPIAAPHTSKTKVATRRKGQKPSLEIATRSQVGAEKNPMLKERSQERPVNSKLDLPDSSKSKLSPSSLAVELGSGKSSSQHNRDPQVETKGSLKQTRERENRSSSLKRDNSSTKVRGGESAGSL